MQFYITKNDWEIINENKPDTHSYVIKLFTRDGASFLFGDNYLDNIIRIDLNQCLK